jgi:hypothetical protein
MLKQGAKRLLRTAFEAGQRIGVDVLPRHFYSEVPDLRELRSSDEWRRPRSLSGIDGLAIERQSEFVRASCGADALARLANRDIFAEACRANGAVGFGPIEAAFLYCLIAERRPPAVVQVGAGVSTAVILAAAEEARHELELTCIDPFPTEYLRGLARDGRITLVAEPVQRVAPERVARVGPGGLLFIDSTHTVKVGSDVSYLVLEVLPGVRERIWVHFHDIYLPYLYAPGVLGPDLFFGAETALVTAFLTGNRAVRVCAAMSMLHYQAPDVLAELFPWYRPAVHIDGVRAQPGHFPASLYLETNPAPEGR